MPEAAAEKKDSPSITVTLDPQFHAYVFKAAKEDERSPAKWLKRFLQEELARHRSANHVIRGTDAGQELWRVSGPVLGATNLPNLDREMNRAKANNNAL